MNRISHLALHDTRRFLKGRENFFFMFAMPVLFMLFFSVVLRGGGIEEVHVSVQVVNEDDGFLSEAFLEQLRAEHFDVDLVAPVRADSVGYVRRLVIPAGFTASLLAYEPVEVGFRKRPSSNIEYDAAADVRLAQAQAAFLGALIRWDDGAAAADDARTVRPAPDAAEQDRLRALIAAEKKVTVTDTYAGRGRPVPRGAGQSIPGMLAMFVVMTVLIGGSSNLTGEKAAGTLSRLAVTTFSRGEIIAGKLLHLGAVGVVQALVLMLAGELIGRAHLFGIDFTWGRGAGVLVLLMVPYAFTVGALTLFIGGLFRTTQQSESLAWLIGMVFAALGGCWWPLEIMPRAAQILGGCFPTYWAMKGLHGVVTFGQGVGAILLPGLILVGYGVLFSWLGSRTMRVAE